MVGQTSYSILGSRRRRRGLDKLSLEGWAAALSITDSLSLSALFGVISDRRQDPDHSHRIQFSLICHYEVPSPVSTPVEPATTLASVDGCVLLGC